MHSTHEGESDIPNLPRAARRTVHIVLPELLVSHSLLSIGQLCNVGCVLEFTAATYNVDTIVGIHQLARSTDRLFRARDIPNLPRAARTIHIVLPELASHIFAPIHWPALQCGLLAYISETQRTWDYKNTFDPILAKRSHPQTEILR
jgi:hypothetical protein